MPSRRPRRVCRSSRRADGSAASTGPSAALAAPSSRSRSPTRTRPPETVTGKRARFADEAEHEGRGRRVVDLVGGADLLDPALAHHHHAVGELHRLLLVVGDEDGGVPGAVVDLAEPAAQLAPHFCVERAERLVEEEHARLDGERSGKRDALPLTAGELTGIALFQARQLHEVEQIQNALSDLRPRRPARARPDFQAEGDVVEHRHVAEERVVLEHEADVPLPHVEIEGVARRRRGRGPRSAHRARRGCEAASSCPSPTGRGAPAARRRRPPATRRAAPAYPETSSRRSRSSRRPASPRATADSADDLADHVHRVALSGGWRRFRRHSAILRPT